MSLPDPDLLKLLIARLERLSADSVWAHRASGVRGALLRMQERLESGQPVEGPRATRLIRLGFQILEGAAKEKTQ
ncbi:MAG: hypothetical protein AB1564_15170 [Chloroflexota bacterium]